MTRPLFKGSIVALVTPFDQKGRVDGNCLAKLVRWHVQQKTDGIIVCGTTGEGASLSSIEKEMIVRIALDAAEKKIPILVGTGTATTRQTVELTQKMQHLGAAGALVVTPYYTKPSPQGCVFHFQEVSKVGLPILLYHNPGRTMVRLSLDTILDIGALESVCGIKESSHNIELVRQLRAASSLPILAGDDDITLDLLKEGAVGAISVIGNLVPQEWSRMIHSALQKNWELAQTISTQHMPLCKTLFLETNPQGLKFAMESLGWIKGSLRLPLVSVGKKVGEAIQQALSSLTFPPFQNSTGGMTGCCLNS